MVQSGAGIYKACARFDVQGLILDLCPRSCT